MVELFNNSDVICNPSVPYVRNTQYTLSLAKSLGNYNYFLPEIFHSLQYHNHRKKSVLYKTGVKRDHKKSFYKTPVFACENTGSSNFKEICDLNMIDVYRDHLIP